MDQLVDTCIELRRHSFDLFGSLDRPEEPEHVGPFTWESLTEFTEHRMRAIGPLSSWEENHRSLLRLILDLIPRQEMCSLQAVDAYLIHRSLLDLVPSVLSPSSSTQLGERPKSFLKQGNQILVDKEFKITTGIIDWEWAHITPLVPAFNSPIDLLPVREISNAAVDLGERMKRTSRACSKANAIKLWQKVQVAAKAEDAHLRWAEWKASALVRFKKRRWLAVGVISKMQVRRLVERMPGKSNATHDLLNWRTSYKEGSYFDTDKMKPRQHDAMAPQNYEPHVDFYAEVASLAAARCRAALERHQIPALVTWRAKRPENLIKKLKKRSKYRQYADETDMLIDAMDLAGVRIALYLPSQEGAVLNLLEEMFVVQDVKIHGDVRYRPPFASENGGNNGGGAAHIKKVLFENRPSGYQAIHAHVELGRQMEGVATLPQHQHRYCSTLAEIQIISLLMHVWAELEHRLVYKAESGEASAREKRILGNFYGSVKTAEALLSGVKTSVVERSQRPERIDEKAKL